MRTALIQYKVLTPLPQELINGKRYDGEAFGIFILENIADWQLVKVAPYLGENNKEYRENTENLNADLFFDLLIDLDKELLDNNTISVAEITTYVRDILEPAVIRVMKHYKYNEDEYYTIQHGDVHPEYNISYN